MDIDRDGVYELFVCFGTHPDYALVYTLEDGALVPMSVIDETGGEMRTSEMLGLKYNSEHFTDETCIQYGYTMGFIWTHRLVKTGNELHVVKGDVNVTIGTSITEQEAAVLESEIDYGYIRSFLFGHEEDVSAELGLFVRPDLG